MTCICLPHIRANMFAAVEEDIITMWTLLTWTDLFGTPSNSSSSSSKLDEPKQKCVKFGWKSSDNVYNPTIRLVLLLSVCCNPSQCRDLLPIHTPFTRVHHAKVFTKVWLTIMTYYRCDIDPQESSLTSASWTLDCSLLCRRQTWSRELGLLGIHLKKI